MQLPVTVVPQLVPVVERLQPPNSVPALDPQLPALHVNVVTERDWEPDSAHVVP